MESFFNRFRNTVARFMYGRYGIDQLGWATLVAEVVLTFVAGFVRLRAVYMVLRLLSTALTVLLLYRMFSRDMVKRRAENAWFLRWWTPLRTGFRDARYRRADKAHKYVKCACGTWCRVPRNVGKVELMCPKCGAKKIVKTG
ncbi:MAG: hypothetical protein IKN81_03215 [Oscillospiraceae bacterium]|nr:hypothetical protein [Oscillospiraceae bacterium]